MPRTVLHIGAHKTATTYLQRTLAGNIDLLTQAGLHYLPLDVLRKNFTGLMQSGEETDIKRDLIARARRQDVLISDENLAGAPVDLIRAGTYYPNIGRKLGELVKILGNPEPEIFFAIRDYGSFNVSMYCEFLRHKDFMLFGDYDAAFAKSRFSWVDTIGQIVAAAPRARVTLWDFADFRARKDAILTAMTGIDAGRFVAPEGQVRESFSARTIMALETLLTVMPASEVRRAANPLGRAFPKGPDYPAFDPLPAHVKDELSARYRDDLATIRRKFPDVRFL